MAGMGGCSAQMYRYYAGIGSRETPHAVCAQMGDLAQALYALNYILRSGGATRADTAFELGANRAYHADPRTYPYKFIFRPDSLLISAKAYELAEKYHPAWNYCSSYARACHARNVHIIFGQELDSPVEFVLCWTKDGKASGGTGQGIRIAEACDIPVINLHTQHTTEEVLRLCLNKAA